MTLLTETYLGNSLQNADLKATLEDTQRQNTCLYLDLDPEECVKGRIHTRTTSGENVGIIKDRSWSIREGDIFLMGTGQWLVVHVRCSEYIVACFSPADIGDPQWSLAKTALELVRLGHCFGNHHWPMGVEQNKITIQLSEHNKDVFEALLQKIDLPGLVVTYEARSVPTDVSSDQLSHNPHTHSSHHL